MLFALGAVASDTRALGGQWITDIWSRNDGFIVNAGVRIRFGD